MLAAGTPHATLPSAKPRDVNRREPAISSKYQGRATANNHHLDTGYTEPAESTLSHELGGQVLAARQV